MSLRSWNRRDFGRMMAMAAVPALVALPGLVGGADAGDLELWPEAKTTLDFYRKHLPAGLQLARPTGSVDRFDRSVTFTVMRGDRQVGQIGLNASFRSNQPTAMVWQATVIAGSWYQSSVANAYKAGEFAGC